MITERLYFIDAYLTHFSARITAQRAAGDQTQVALDQSAFYPEGGGQPSDHGALNGVPVLDVQVEDGVVWHTLAEQPASEAVRGTIDWARRLDHMQQHHGQHLLSAAFERLFGLRTVSFHLGAALATIDLATEALATEQAQAVEDLVNQVIWENRPVLARFVTGEELASLPLRKPPTVDGAVRVVSVPDFDHSACGGTHPRTTGGVGLLHIRRWERRGDTLRVEFLCGGRAVADYRRRDAIIGRLAGGLSVAVDDLEPAIERLRASAEHARKQLEQARAQLLLAEAEQLRHTAQSLGGVPLVRRAFAARNVDELRELARLLAGAGAVALLGSGGDRAQLVFARADGLPLDCGALLRSTLAALGGRGGGQPGLAQGGLPDAAQLDAALDAAAEAVAHQLL